MQKNQRKKFGAVLAGLRAKSGLTQTAVAKTLEYSTAQFISNWERGASTPPVKEFKKLASLYRTPVKKLVDTYYEHEEASLKAERKELLKTLR